MKDRSFYLPFVSLSLSQQRLLKIHLLYKVFGKSLKIDSTYQYLTMIRRVTILKIRRTPKENINQELQWIGNSLGLFSLRDKNSSCFRIFIVLLKKAKSNQIISSDEIADRLKLTRGTVVHHLNNLMNSGIVIREQGGYILRERNLERVISSIRKDLDSAMSELMKVAKEVDEKLG
jgi:predicted transcriptional regulator